jgi:cytochrome P450
MSTARAVPASPQSPPGLRRNLLWQALRTMRPVNPLLFFERLEREYGPVARYKVGRQEIVLVSEPEYVREILTVQPDRFVKERTVQRSKLLLGDGMITAEGAAHKTQRRVAQPAFHRERIPGYAATMVEEAVRRRAQWRHGMRADVAQEMMELTLEIVARTLFSTELRQEVKQVTAAISSIMRLYNFLVLLPGAEVLVNWPIPGATAFRRARARLDATVFRMIEQHRANGDRGDLLSMMLAGNGFTDQELRDQVITMFLAGYETTANALTWTWYLLSQNPEAERRLHAEVDEVLAGRPPNYNDLPRLRYTEMVLAESMRLFPPAWAMGRKALRDVQLGPYLLPAGITVVASQWVIQRSPRFFPDPLRFDPERFTPERKAHRPKLAYFPFGGGPRQCIGESFAWMEAVLVLATLAQKFRLRLVPGHRVEPQPLITLRPKYGMRMDLEHRVIV